MSAILSPYHEAHLFVAAIRVLAHRKSAPPAVEEVCGELALSREWGHAVCRRLKEAGIVETVEDPFSVKLFVADYGKIEELPREVKESGLNQDLENFRKSKEDMTKKVETIQAELARKRADLFADLEKKMKKQE